MPPRAPSPYAAQCPGISTRRSSTAAPGARSSTAAAPSCSAASSAPRPRHWATSRPCGRATSACRSRPAATIAARGRLGTASSCTARVGDTSTRGEGCRLRCGVRRPVRAREPYGGRRFRDGRVCRRPRPWPAVVDAAGETRARADRAGTGQPDLAGCCAYLAR